MGLAPNSLDPYLFGGEDGLDAEAEAIRDFRSKLLAGTDDGSQGFSLHNLHTE